ncbi:hypothetical protein BH18ACT8_BH18ACT8_02670 [soil metagenome]
MRDDASVLHLDLDAFFAAVEQRDKPSLRHKPVVVGGIGPRGVVATASYEARRFGVHSAMSTAEARSRCPHAAYLSPRFEVYRRSSERVLTRLREVSSLVEPLSLDEAFIDLAPCPDVDRTVAGVRFFAEGLREDVKRLTGGLTASVGIGSSKLIAKIASELAKPDGCMVVAPGTEHDVLRPPSVTVIPGVGPATAELLRRLGVVTVADLESVSNSELVHLLVPAHGASLFRLARADDDRAVQAEREAKSISVEDTFDSDLVDIMLLNAVIERMSARVADRLNAVRLSGRTVVLKVRRHDFSTYTRSTTLPGPTDDRRVIAGQAARLLREIDTSDGVRLLGVGVSGLTDWIQDDLFTQPGEAPECITAEEPTAVSPPGQPPRRWWPGADVVHAEHGCGWVWGAGRGRVTVRFETAKTPAGPVRTFRDDDPALTFVDMLSPDPPDNVTLMTPLQRPRAPLAKRVPTFRTHHGDTVEDPYDWLRDKDDPEVIAHLEAENAYTEAMTSHLADLRSAIFDEIKSRTQETDLSVPNRRGSWWYYSRTQEGQQYPLHCRCPVADPDDWTPPTLAADVDVPDEQLLLDGNEEARGHDFFAIGTFSVSPDGHLLAYSVDTTGAERFTLRAKDLRTMTVLEDEIPDTFYASAWSLDGSRLFYLTVDASWRPCRVWRHRVGSSAAEDVMLYEEADERFWLGLGSTRSDRYVVVSASSKITSEVRVLEVANPDAELRVVAARREGVEYSIEHAVVAGQDTFLILHNAEAENFALAAAPVDDAGPDQWRTVIEHRPDTRLERVSAFADHIAVGLRRDALSRVAVMRLVAEGYDEPREIEFDEELFGCDLGDNPEWHQPLLRIVFTSFVTPLTVYDFDISSAELFLRKRKPVLGGYDPAQYEQHREWATAVDGTLVPISVVNRIGVARDGTAPCLLYGYGSYEISIEPSFDIARLSLLDRGVVYAVAHIRGGGELGRAWYEDGRILAKANTFTDFVACARYLADSGVTSAQRLVAVGGSAGGLLMGAALNLAPDAFAGVLAVVPFVDALTTILNPSLPLTVQEWDEWGDPLHDPAVYAYMKRYTPYENVAAKAYPPVLAVTSLNDTRVYYVEPAKWVARLRATKTDDSPILLKTEMVAGHGGKSGRYEAWKEQAFMYAWVLDVLGSEQQAKTTHS